MPRETTSDNAETCASQTLMNRNEDLSGRAKDSIDAQRLASLLDGRLEGAIRDQILTELAMSPEAMSDAADAAAVLAELESSGTTPMTTDAPRPLRRSPNTRLRWGIGIAAAIVLAVVPSLIVRNPSASAEASPARFVALVSTGADARNWSPTRWSRTRGAGGSQTPERLAIRLGIRITDLEIAHRYGLPERPIADDIARLIDGDPGLAPARQMFQDVAFQGDSASDADRIRAYNALTGIVDRPSLDRGAWLEAARFAAGVRDREFFQSSESRQLLQSATSQSEAPAPDDDQGWRELEQTLMRSASAQH